MHRKAVYGGILLFVVVVILFTYSCREKTLFKKDILTDTVSRGNVYKYVTASGEVAAENEVIILSPYTSVVQDILKLPGHHVKKGEIIITLDETGIENRIENLRDELEVSENNLLKLRLSAQNSRMDMDHDIEVKKLRILSLEAELNDIKALFEVGGTSQANIDRIEQELVLAKKDLEHTSKKHDIRFQQLKADENGLNLQIEMKEKQLKAALETRKKLWIASPGKGTIMEINARKGEMVRENELIIRISEHTKMKIKAEISDEYQNVLRNGGKVFVKLEDKKLEGTIGNIRPVIEDDKVRFEVFLKNPKNNDLRVNKKVELQVVSEERNNVLRVKKTQRFENPKRDVCFKVEGEKAIVKNVVIGLFGDEYVEIKQGLDSGDVVIVSDLPSGKNRKVVEIKKNDEE